MCALAACLLAAWHTFLACAAWIAWAGIAVLGVRKAGGSASHSCNAAVAAPSAAAAWLTHCLLACSGGCPQVNLGSLQQQLAALQLQTGGERISPTLDAILELLDEAPPEGAAAAADDFVRQVVETSGDAAAAACQPWMQQRGEQAAATAAAVAGAEDGGEQPEDGQAGMEGVVAEYAAVGAPEPADALGGGCSLAGVLVCASGSWLRPVPANGACSHCQQALSVP